MKALLAILVVALQVAGPWLCCCTVGLFAPTACCAPDPDCAAPRGCPHCPAPAEPTRPSPPKPCCWLAAPHDAAVVPVEPVVPADPASAALPVTLDTPRPAAPFVGNRLPFLTAETKLFAHHVLRC